jgi:hypothetical protein
MAGDRALVGSYGQLMMDGTSDSEDIPDPLQEQAILTDGGSRTRLRS